MWGQGSQEQWGNPGECWPSFPGHAAAYYGQFPTGADGRGMHFAPVSEQHPTGTSHSLASGPAFFGGAYSADTQREYPTDEELGDTEEDAHAYTLDARYMLDPNARPEFIPRAVSTGNDHSPWLWVPPTYAGATRECWANLRGYGHTTATEPPPEAEHSANELSWALDTQTASEYPSERAWPPETTYVPTTRALPAGNVLEVLQKRGFTAKVLAPPAPDDTLGPQPYATSPVDYAGPLRAPSVKAILEDDISGRPHPDFDVKCRSVLATDDRLFNLMDRLSPQECDAQLLANMSWALARLWCENAPAMAAVLS